MRKQAKYQREPNSWPRKIFTTFPGTSIFKLLEATRKRLNEMKNVFILEVKLGIFRPTSTQPLKL